MQQVSPEEEYFLRLHKAAMLQNYTRILFSFFKHRASIIHYILLHCNHIEIFLGNCQDTCTTYAGGAGVPRNNGKPKYFHEKIFTFTPVPHTHTVLWCAMNTTTTMIYSPPSHFYYLRLLCMAPANMWIANKTEVWTLKQKLISTRIDRGAISLKKA